MKEGLVFFGTVTVCMMIGIFILELLGTELNNPSYVVGLFSATIAAVAARIVSAL